MTEAERKLAESAKQLLASETFRALIEELEGEAIDIFANSKPDQTADREAAYYLMQAIGLFKTKLQGYAAELSVQDKREESRKLHS